MGSHFMSSQRPPLRRRQERDEQYLDERSKTYQEKHPINVRTYSSYASPLQNRDLVDDQIVTKRPFDLQYSAGYRPALRHDLEYRPQDTVPLGRALRQLCIEIDRAVKMYNWLLLAFRKDIEPVKLYATSGILNQLWELKINGGNGRRKAFIDECRSAWYSVSEAMKIVLLAPVETAARQRPTMDTHREDAVRLRGKVQSTSRQVHELWDKFFDSEHACKVLTRELEDLRNKLRPDTNDNKDLFAAIGESEAYDEDDPQNFTKSEAGKGARSQGDTKSQAEKGKGKGKREKTNEKIVEKVDEKGGEQTEGDQGIEQPWVIPVANDDQPWA